MFESVFECQIEHHRSVGCTYDVGNIADLHAQVQWMIGGVRLKSHHPLKRAQISPQWKGNRSLRDVVGVAYGWVVCLLHSMSGDAGDETKRILCAFKSHRFDFLLGHFELHIWKDNRKCY